MFVEVASPVPVLLRGSTAELTATVWIRRGAGDSVEVRNAELVWTTSDQQLATVTAIGGSGVRVTGVNPGIVEIGALAPGYEGAAPGRFQLRVANPLEIDSISPDTVRYGELLTAYGVGVGSLFFAGLGNGTLGIDSLAVAGDPSGLGAQSFWVAYPASSGPLVAAGSGQLVAAPEPTVVLPWDIYEPNQIAPATIALDGPPPIRPPRRSASTTRRSPSRICAAPRSATTGTGGRRQRRGRRTPSSSSLPRCAARTART